MKIIIIGNMGYVGPVVVRHLRNQWPHSELIGYDSGLFSETLVGDIPPPERLLDRQLVGDIRDITADIFIGADAVIHLAALSNDPIGREFEEATKAINEMATLRVAELARAAGVASFVFASSCSVYGYAEGSARREGDPLDPLTAYARSKVAVEEGLKTMGSSAMKVTCLRFATACGWSPRLRLDLVLNDFVATALREGVVKVQSDGTPWRPLIDVQDMARAIDWAVNRLPTNGGPFLVVNAGSDAWNYQVRDLAQSVADSIGNVAVSINRDAPPDRRSYRVDFSAYRTLAPQHQPQMTLSQTIGQLVAGLKAASRIDGVRLATLRRLIAEGRLSSDLRWVDSPVFGAALSQ